MHQLVCLSDGGLPALAVAIGPLCFRSVDDVVRDLDGDTGHQTLTAAEE